MTPAVKRLDALIAAVFSLLCTLLMRRVAMLATARDEQGGSLRHHALGTVRLFDKFSEAWWGSTLAHNGYGGAANEEGELSWVLTLHEEGTELLAKDGQMPLHMWTTPEEEEEASKVFVESDAAADAAARRDALELQYPAAAMRAARAQGREEGRREAEGIIETIRRCQREHTPLVYAEDELKRLIEEYDQAKEPAR